jgi:biopolymer transport protein ExbD
MGGIDTPSVSSSQRRSLDSEINMIPMIDLLMVTISFLLITAVWTHMSRVNADAAVPGPRDATVEPPPLPETQLHVMMQSPEKFVLAWRQGNATVDSFELPRTEGPGVAGAQGQASGLRFPGLAARIEREWRSRGQHTNPADAAFDRVVLHTADATAFRDIVGVIDAISATPRDVVTAGKRARVPAFHVVFAVN